MDVANIHLANTKENIMSEFKVGDKVFLRYNSEFNVEGTVTIIDEDYKDIVWVNWGKGKSDNWYLYIDLCLVPTTEDTPTYIEELEDRINYLEDLCTENYQIICDLEHKHFNVNKKLDHFAKLTHILSNNHNVAELVGANVGDDVVVKIYDYLCGIAPEKVAVKTKFKDIVDMDELDWVEAIRNRWVFKNRFGQKVKISEFRKGKNYPVICYPTDSYTLSGQYYQGINNEADLIKRIK